jgi:hypothetical protein
MISIQKLIRLLLASVILATMLFGCSTTPVILPTTEIPIPTLDMPDLERAKPDIAMSAAVPFPVFPEEFGMLPGRFQADIIVQKWSEAAGVYAENERTRQLLIDWIKQENINESDE